MTMLIKMMILLLIFLPTKVPAENLAKNLVAECIIFDHDFKVIKNFGGNSCVFLDDGSYVVSPDELAPNIKKYSAEGDLQWNLGIHSHHQIQLTNDKKSLLVLSSEGINEHWCRARYEVFYILDLKTGRVLFRKSVKDYLLDFEKVFGLVNFKTSYFESSLLNTNCIFTHYNTFRPVPVNSIEKAHPEFSHENFILNNNRSNILTIFDKKLTRPVWSEVPPINWTHGNHDVQFLPDGKFIFYQGEHFFGPGDIRMGIFRYDPLEHQLETIYPPGPNNYSRNYSPFVNSSTIGGSVQKTEWGYLISHNDLIWGGSFLFLDINGNLIRRVSNPHRADFGLGRPFNTLQISEQDVSLFLQNNRM